MATPLKQQYLDSVMRTLIKAVSALLFSIGLAVISIEAEAAPSEAPRTSAEQGAENSPDDSAKQSGNAKSAANDSDFVDKDGDGIRDGQEHRFRRRSKHGKDADRHTGKQRRKKGQRGKGSGS